MNTLENLDTEIKQLEATLERVMKVLEKTEARHAEEIKTAEDEIAKVVTALKTKIEIKSISSAISNEGETKREKELAEYRAAFLSVRSDLKKVGIELPESFEYLGIALGVELEESPPDDQAT